MKKLELYAKELQQLKNKTLSVITDLANEGDQGWRVSYSQKDIDFARSETPERITKRTLDKYRKLYTKSAIQRRAKVEITEIYKDGQYRRIEATKISDLTGYDITHGKALAQKVNKAITNKVTFNKEKKQIKSESMARDLDLLLSSLDQNLGIYHGSGLVTDKYSISKDFKDDNATDLLENVKVKDVDTESGKAFALRIFQNPYASEELYKKFKETSANIAFETFADRLGISISPAVNEQLNYLIRSNKLWSSVAPHVPDSEQAAEEMRSFIKKLNQASETLDLKGLEEIVRMIENQESFMTIEAAIDQMIKDIRS